MDVTFSAFELAWPFYNISMSTSSLLSDQTGIDPAAYWLAGTTLAFTVLSIFLILTLNKGWLYKLGPVFVIFVLAIGVIFTISNHKFLSGMFVLSAAIAGFVLGRCSKRNDSTP